MRVRQDINNSAQWTNARERATVSSRRCATERQATHSLSQSALRSRRSHMRRGVRVCLSHSLNLPMDSTRKSPRSRGALSWIC